MKRRICRYCHRPSTGSLKLCPTCKRTRNKHAEIEERNNARTFGDCIDLDSYAALDTIRGGFRRPYHGPTPSVAPIAITIDKEQQ